MDELDALRRLAGVKPKQSETLSDVGSNISLTGMEKRRIERERNIRPGTDAWFKLWFARPYLTGEQPVDVDPKKGK
jgi:hypothetical protein